MPARQTGRGEGSARTRGNVHHWPTRRRNFGAFRTTRREKKKKQRKNRRHRQRNGAAHALGATLCDILLQAEGGGVVFVWGAGREGCARCPHAQTLAGVASSPGTGTARLLPTCYSPHNKALKQGRGKALGAQPNHKRRRLRQLQVEGWSGSHPLWQRPQHPARMRPVAGRGRAAVQQPLARI